MCRKWEDEGVDGSWVSGEKRVEEMEVLWGG